MSPSIDPFSVGVVVLTVLLGGLAVVVVRATAAGSARAGRASIPLVALVAGAGGWAVANAASAGLAAVGPALLVHRLSFVGAGVVVAGWFATGLAVAGYDRRYVLPVVAVEPVLVGIGVVTNPYHHLFFTEVRLVAAEGTGVAATPGPLFFVHSVVSYAVLVAGLVVLVVGLGRVDRRVAAGVLPALVLPLAFQVAFVLGVAPVPVDATPLGVAAAALAVAVALRYDGRSDATARGEGPPRAGEPADASGWRDRAR